MRTPSAGIAGSMSCRRWRWADYWDPVREVIYFKREVYRRALHELGALAFPAGLPAYPDWWPGEEQTAAGR